MVLEGRGGLKSRLEWSTVKMGWMLGGDVQGGCVRVQWWKILRMDSIRTVAESGVASRADLGLRQINNWIQ